DWLRMIEQLSPGTLDRHLLYRPTVSRQPALLYEPAVGEQLDAPPVRPPVQRDGQLELGGIDADRGARNRHALRIARKLEFGPGGAQILERQIAVTQDVDLTVLYAAVDAARHLKNFVRPEVGARQHVLAALDDVRVAGVVDHHGIKAANVKRGLSRRGHSE